MPGGKKRVMLVRCDTLVTPFQRVEGRVLYIADGKIAKIFPPGSAVPDGITQILHEPGAIVAPGFIDLHVHGARGRDLMDGTLESLQAVSSALARHGTTSFLATTMSAPFADIKNALLGFAGHRTSVRDGAVPLGIHLEGPFLNPIRKGTHNASYLTLPTLPALEQFCEFSDHAIRKMTMAPELEGAIDLIRRAVGMGMTISLGHSDATAAEAKAAVDAGARHATHVFNAMRPLHQREPGILGVVLTDDRVWAEVIADGVHVHPAALQMLLRLKGPGRTLLVSDGLSAVDMPEGQYPLGDKFIMVKDGACRDPDGTLAGSILTLDRAVQNVVRWFGLSLEDALTAASASPAQSLGLNNKGIVTEGKDADLVFLDSDLNVVKTMVAGRVVYKR